jgi:OFA family oxalate/formate antiporter-like MFS transporter
MDILKKRWIYIIAGFAVFLFLGCSLAWSIFVVPIESQFGWSRSETSLIFTVNILCFSVGSIGAGILSKRLSFSTLLKLAALLLFIGFFGCSMITNIWQLFIAYGFIVGSAIGLGYNCIISSCPLWLPEKTGTATGILLMGYALSTAIFGPLLNKLISSIGIMNTFKTLAFICGIGIFIGSFFIRNPSIEELEQLPKVDNKTNKKTYNVITSEMIKKPIFYVYYLITICVAGIGLSIINHNSQMLTETLKTTASFAAIIVSVVSITNGVGRFMWGIVYDKIGVKKSLISIAIILIVACVGLLSSLLLQNVTLYVISACLMLLSYAGNAITCPAITRELFGHRTFSLNYSVVSTCAIFQSFFPSVIGSLQQSTGSYITPITILLMIAVFTLIIVIIFIKIYHKNYELNETR